MASKPLPPSPGPYCLPPAPPPDPALAAFWRELDRHISARHLSQADRNAVWRYIKATRPDQVAFFEDPTVKQLLAMGASVAFPPQLIDAARRAMTEATQ